jgi:hypothetical protein
MFCITARTQKVGGFRNTIDDDQVKYLFCQFMQQTKMVKELLRVFLIDGANFY